MTDPKPKRRLSSHILGSTSDLRSIPTRRSLLPLPVAGASDPRWEDSWRHLLEVYGPALRAYVSALLRAARASSEPEDAADIVQAYLTACLEKGWLQRDGGEIRSFRAYLKVQVRRFTWSWLREQHALKRRPPHQLLEADLEARASASPELDIALDAAFVQSAVERCCTQLAASNAVYAEIIADLLRTEGVGSSDLATRLGREPRDLAVLRHRARRRFAHLLAEELRATVRDAESFHELLVLLEPHLP